MRLMGKFFILITLLTGLFIQAGCAKEQGPPPESAITDVRSYFPADPALTWSYEGTGNEYASFTRRVMSRQGSQVQMAENNGGTRLGQVYDVTADAVILTLSREEFYTDQSLFGEKSNRRHILLKAPLKAGAVWQDEQDKREIIGIDETVQVPAGSYRNVIKVKITSLDPRRHDQRFEYYAPDTGLIMREFVDADYSIISALKSFKKTVASEIKEATIVLEGMPQKFTLHLVEGDPLPFYTYIPSDMTETLVRTGEGAGFLFNTNFAGNRRDDVYLTIIFYPQRTKLAEGIHSAERLLSQPGWQKTSLPPEQSYPWAAKQWSFRHTASGIGYIGSLAVGQHNNLVFYIMTHYPPEFGDGFLPRSRKILDEFVWTDTNEKLQMR